MKTRAPKFGWTGTAEPSGLPTGSPEAANDSEPNEANLRQPVQRARLLFDAVAGRGLAVNPWIIEAILTIEREIETDTPPAASTLAQFVNAYEALLKIAGGDPADALSADARRDRRRSRRIYFLFFIGLMLVAIPLTTISTVGGKLAKDVVAQIGSTCRDYPVLYCDPATRNEETSYNHFPYAVNDLTNRTNHISDSLWVLAFFADLLQPADLHGELAKISSRNSANIWSSFLEIFSRSGTIIDRFQLYYGTLASYLLPIVFGMLGAVAFGLRELRRRTDLPHGRGRGGPMMAILRICIAGLAGYLVTVTGDVFTGLQAPAIFVAFLLGYSIDVFFTLLDKAVLRVRAVSAVQRPKTSRG